MIIFPPQLCPFSTKDYYEVKSYSGKMVSVPINVPSCVFAVG